MKLTFTADSTGAVAAIDVPEEGIETLLAILEAEFGIPSSSIIMVHNGRALQLSPSSSLASVGVADGDMVIVADARNVRTGAGAGAASRPSAAGAGAHGARGSKKRTLTAKPAPNIPTEMYTRCVQCRGIQRQASLTGGALCGVAYTPTFERQRLRSDALSTCSFST